MMPIHQAIKATQDANVPDEQWALYLTDTLHMMAASSNYISEFRDLLNAQERIFKREYA